MLIGASYDAARNAAKTHRDNGHALEGAGEASESELLRGFVLMYYGSATHVPRTEDWPGMRVEWAGFTLRPRDFLDASPVQPK